MRRVAAALALALAFWSAAWAGEDGTIVVASKQFTEGRLLSEIMAQLLEARTDLKVERRMDLGGTRIVFDALKAGEIDVYPEYTGTGLLEILGEPRAGGAQATYEKVKEEFRRQFGLVWLEPMGFNNSYALTMTRKRADELGIRTISDLEGHPSLRMGISLEFLNRADGWKALVEAYGLKMTDVRGMQHGLAYEAISQGQIDVTDAYTTDGKLERYGLVVLEDDRAFFPPYYAAPVVREEVLRKHPEVEKVLNLLAGSLTDAEVQKLNYRIEEGKEAFPTVARSFLESRGLISKTDEPVEAGRSTSFLAYLSERRGEMLDLVGQHLFLTGVSVAIAALVGIPLGILITRWTAAASPVLAVAGVIQTIPGLALLAFMIPVPGLGLGTRSAILALSLYALLPIVRNTWTGLRSVDPGVLEAARGMGMRPGQILTMVELPLAIPTLMAGLRTSAVITVGVATLAAFVGAGGLGEPILTGLYLNDNVLILAGAVPAAVLAILVDQALGLMEGLLTPRGLAPRRK